MNDDTAYIRDRLELQDLATTYARAIDRRDYAAFARTFTKDGRLIIIFGDPETVEPAAEMHGSDQIVQGVSSIEQYERTTHFLGQQHVEITGDTASGETYCLAYHLRPKDGEMWNLEMSIRYQDKYTRESGRWQFTERTVICDWTDDKPLTESD